MDRMNADLIWKMEFDPSDLPPILTYQGVRGLLICVNQCSSAVDCTLSSQAQAPCRIPPGDPAPILFAAGDSGDILSRR
jgi:hypothetical protein